jgi:hypothetical protein
MPEIYRCPVNSAIEFVYKLDGTEPLDWWQRAIEDGVCPFDVGDCVGGWTVLDVWAEWLDKGEWEWVVQFAAGPLAARLTLTPQEWDHHETLAERLMAAEIRHAIDRYEATVASLGEPPESHPVPEEPADSEALEIVHLPNVIRGREPRAEAAQLVAEEP